MTNITNNIYGEMALKIARHTQEGHQGDDRIKRLDPATIALIVKLLVSLVECFLKKKLNMSAALAKAQNPGFIGRYQLRGLVNKELKRENCDVPKKFGKALKQYRTELVASTLKYGKDITEAEIVTAMEFYKETAKKMGMDVYDPN